MAALLCSRLHALRRGESGQSLILVALMMTLFVSVAGYGIDAASWMVRHHQAQVVADAAALAAAQCLANPNQSGQVVINGTPTTLPPCTSSTDTSDAQTVAVDYAAANGMTITNSNVSVNTGTDVVTVTAPTSSAGTFARMLGLGTTSQTASAGAGWSAGASACGSPGGPGCDFMFADNSDCSSSSSGGISLTMAGTATVQGEIQSNGNLNATISGSISLGTGTYGPTSNGSCGHQTVHSGSSGWTTPPTAASANYSYPINYAQDFPACGGSGQLACQSNGYPSFCTSASTSISLTGSGSGGPASDNVYCASGSGTKSDPSTWNGSINVTTSGSYTLYDTFVGGSITYTGSGTDTLSSCGYAVSGYASSNCSSTIPAPATTNYPIFYATGTGSNALSITVSGSQGLNGDLFAPNGTAALTMSGTQTLVTCIEADNISGSVAGSFEGDGPVAGTTSSSALAGVTLVQ
jgi:Flp pilus assembly protein TadG